MRLPAPLGTQHNIGPSLGFTLIELLLAIAIVGILAAIVMPSLTGIYNRQILDNSANEMVSTIKMVQNRALTNSQSGYSGDEDELINDCTASKAYVKSFVFEVINTTSYQPQRVFKALSNSDVVCPQPNTPQDISLSATTTLPDGIHFASNDPSWSVEYASVTGSLTTSDPTNPANTSRTFYTLTSDYVPDQTYYVCVTQGRVYVQQNTACW